MTQEEKKLLLIDLCARFPYGVKVHITDEWFYDKIEPYDRRLDCDVIKSIRENQYTVKPYLRSMGSMTDEERDEFRNVGGVMSHNLQNDTWAISAFTPEAYDWLNKYGFDYRGLIPMGLALEA